MFEVIITNCRIIDGSGNPWYKADIGISGGKITKISRVPLIPPEGVRKVVDAGGLVVSPGFINIHSHSDGTILTHNNAENCLAMGLTTEIVGNCGSSAAPITTEHREKQNLLKRGSSWGFWEDVDWLSLEGWFHKLNGRGTGVNIGSLVGHSSVRGCVMGVEGEGGERIVPTSDEVSEMKSMVESAMLDGAFGLSTGLTYPIGRNALTEELVELVSVVARYGGVYFSHMRNEGGMLIEATQEFIETCERAGARGSISHHKASGPTNFGKVHETLRLVEEARKRGVDIIVDLYPWRIGSITKSLGSRFRSHLSDGSRAREELVEKLKDPETWGQIIEQTQTSRISRAKAGEEWRRRIEGEGGWVASFQAPSGIILYSKSHPELEWKTFKDVAEVLSGGDEQEGIRALLIEDDGYTVSGNYPFSEEDMFTIMRYPWSTFITDQRSIDSSKYSYQDAADRLAMEHPRGWGTYPKVLGEYVREKKILKIEDAIRKITHLPATIMGIPDRGLVKEGFWADLVVFDPETVGSRATYGNPFQFPSGIPYVMVNGELSVDNGEFTGALAGRVIRRG